MTKGTINNTNYTYDIGRDGPHLSLIHRILMGIAGVSWAFYGVVVLFFNNDRDTIDIIGGVSGIFAGLSFLSFSFIGKYVVKHEKNYLKITEGILECKLHNWDTQKVDLTQVTSIKRGSNYLIFKVSGGEELFICPDDIANTDKRQEFLGLINQFFPPPH